MSNTKIPITNTKQKIRVGITMGDPSGIGPETIIKAIARLRDRAEFTIIGNKWVLDKISRHKSRFNMVDLDNVNRANFCFGRIRSEYGRAALEYLDKALKMLDNGQIDCLVTAPVSKEAINKAGIRFSGHTQYLARHFNNTDTVMLLLNDRLKISLVTQHIPLAKVSRAISEAKIYKMVLLTIKGLKDLFGIKHPRLVVCGLNPHASDNGVMGTEEKEILKPAIKKINKNTAYIEGPLSADVAIAQAAKGKFDCVVAMYHDQALIPLKLTSPKNLGVNLTLGLPFIRTSPLHGTAFDIAGKGIADYSSFLEAVKLAIKCARSQKKD